MPEVFAESKETGKKQKIITEDETRVKSAARLHLVGCWLV